MRNASALLFGVLVVMLSPRAILAQGDANGVAICTVSGSQAHSVVVGDGTGGAIIVWTDFRDYRAQGADVYAQHVLPSGQRDLLWPGNGLPVCALVGDQALQSAVTDGAGGVIVAWTDWRMGQADGLSDVYAQHVLASGILDPKWPANGLLACGAASDQTYPRVASDHSGGAIVCWGDERTTTRHIYAQHLLAEGLTDPAWPTDGRLLCTARGGETDARIAEDGAGGAIVVWTDEREFTYDIYAQRILASGVVDQAWPPTGLPVCTADEDQGDEHILSDGHGGVIVSWTDARAGSFPYYSGYNDVYAQHVLGAGSVDPAWPADGLAVCDTVGDQAWSALVDDGAGGAIIVWEDARNSPWDIYAHHLFGSGSVDTTWPRQGLPVRAGVPGQTYLPVAASDGARGAIVAWPDGRSTDFDIYAQHVRASGTIDPGWPKNGRAICAANDQQYDVAIGEAGEQRAIVAWGDFRSGNEDLYAKRLVARTPIRVFGMEPRGDLSLHISESVSRAGPTAIAFNMPSPDLATVEVFDVAGRAVRVLARRAAFGAGPQTVLWDGRDWSGSRLRDGVYLVRVSTGAMVATGKMALID
jgi:hypothetical protein